METKNTTNMVKPEKWNAALEKEIGSDGTPYQIAWGGSILTVTRRCARVFVRTGRCLNANAVRGPGPNLHLDDKGRSLQVQAAQQQAEKHGLDIEIRWSRENANYSVRCPQMNCSYTTKNPTREISVLLGEWTEICESDGLAAEIAAEKLNKVNS